MKLNNFFQRFEHSWGRIPLIARLIVFVLGVMLLSLFAHEFELYIPELEAWIKSLGSLAPLAFIALFVLATPFFLSVDALCLASGVLFPLLAGSVYIVIATYLAAAVIFVSGRYLFREKVKNLLEKYPKLARLDQVLLAHDFRVMFVLRLLPLPFALLSYAFAVTQVRFLPYILSTSGILLYNLTLVYFGFAAKHIASAATASKSTAAINYPWLIFGVIAVLLILALVVRFARRMVERIDHGILEMKENEE